eukprot:CAMPEP_0170600756 /NCGR_PEP_ID=MMETSP0224-20130122/17500_1 /TAXON_ID=285029 /ORGANISM="Togula jolla, Strain CCCM 725" /LENGTH=322 /DNA_ID=CAMNT_0010925495 /DNA_START=81 /DNA_END=1049 /DNA_ORIENTATION=+
MPASASGAETPPFQRSVTLESCREKHMRCIEVLRSGTKSASASRELNRQHSAPGGHLSTPVGGLGGGGGGGGGMSWPDDRLEKMASDMRKQSELAQELATCVRDLRNETLRGYQELRVAVDEQSRVVEALRAQESHIGIKAVKEVVEKNDRMEALRAQETHIALDKLQEGIREISPSMAALRDNIEMQSRAIRAQPQALSVEISVLLQKMAAQHNQLNDGMQALRDGLVGTPPLESGGSPSRDRGLMAWIPADGEPGEGGAVREMRFGNSTKGESRPLVVRWGPLVVAGVFALLLALLVGGLLHMGAANHSSRGNHVRGRGK